MTSNAKTLNDKVSKGIVLRGWHLIGPGPARFGWAHLGAGWDRFLGRTASEALATLAKDDEGRDDGADAETAADFYGE